MACKTLRAYAPSPVGVSHTTTSPEPPTPESAAAGGQNSARAQESEQSTESEPKQLLVLFGEVLEYFSYYLSAKADSLKLRGRSALFRVELEIVAVLGAAGAVIAAVTLISRGVAEGLTQLFGNRSWLGNLAAGVLLLGCVGLAVGGWTHWWNKTSRERTVHKYEQRKRQQQAKYGRSVAEQAAA